MIDAYVFVTPVLLLLLVGMLLRFVGCSSFGTASFVDPATPDMVSTFTTLSGFPNPATAGQAVIFTATVTASTGGVPTAGGKVDLKELPSNLDTVSLDPTKPAGVVTFKPVTFTTAGNHSIQAVYAGVPGLAFPSLSTAWMQVVNAAAPPPPPAPIKHLQGAENSENLNTSAVSTAAFGAGNTAGNLIVVWIFWHNATPHTLAGVTDTAGNTYQRAIGPTPGVGTLAGWQQEIWFAKNIKTGAANKVSAAFSGTFLDEKSIGAFEYSGADPTVPVDKFAAGTGAGVNASVGPVTTTARGLVFAAAVFKNNGTAGAGFTQRSSLQSNAAEDENTAAAGPATATFTNTAQDWIAQMVTLK